MKLYISTIKKGKVFVFMNTEDNVSRDLFKSTVLEYVVKKFNGKPSSGYISTSDSTKALVVILDVNNDHEDAQIEIDV